MYQLIYLSSATRQLSADALLDLLKVSRENNIKHNITGMLLYFDGNFLQLMEGAEEDVTRLFAIIEKDTRHTGIITVEEGPVSKRLFSDWSMGFKETSMKEINELPGYTDITAKDFLQHITDNNDSYGLQILQTFRNNMTAPIII